MLPMLLIGAVVVVAAVVLFLFRGGSDDEPGTDVTKPSQSVGQSGQAYDLVWPDLMSYLGEGNYEQVMTVSDITFGADGREIYDLRANSPLTSEWRFDIEIPEGARLVVSDPATGLSTGTSAPGDSDKTTGWRPKERLIRYVRRSAKRPE